MKIGMYSDDEILEHLTEGEGRSFLGRSMYDAIKETFENKDKEIDRLNNIINEAKKELVAIDGNLVYGEISDRVCHVIDILEVGDKE